MCVSQIWIFLVFAILGAASKGLPDVRERDLSGPLEDPRGLEEKLSSGKLNCTDCDPSVPLKDGGSRDAETGYHSVGEGSRNHGDKEIAQQEKKTTTRSRKRKGRHRQMGQKSTENPLISMGGIKLQVDEEHDTPYVPEVPDTTLEHGNSDTDKTRDLGSRNYEEDGKSKGVDIIGDTYLSKANKAKSFKENEGLAHKHSSEVFKKDETRKLAANIRHNIQTLGKISAEIQRLTHGNNGHTLEQVDGGIVGKDSDNAGSEHVDISLGNTQVGEQVKKPVNRHGKKPVSSIVNKPDSEVMKSIKASVSEHEKIPVSEIEYKNGHNSGKDIVNKGTRDVKGRNSASTTKELAETSKGEHIETADHRMMPSDVTDKDKDKTDHIVLGKVDDRWSRPGLNQVPEAARLERRLHPTIDAPIRDIMRSLGQMLHTVQGSIYRADHDYQYIFNSTRWTLMVGVREKLTKLIVQNDDVYDTVLQAALLTKGIYRRAHERRRHGSVLAPASLMSRDPAISSMYLRPLHEKVLDEVENARRLKSFVTSTIRQRGDINLELVKIQHKLEDSLPSRTLQDLSRRAKHAMSILESAHAQRDAQDEVDLFGHMHRNTFLNMEQARNFTRVGWEELMYAKRKSVESKQLASDIVKAHREKVPGLAARLPIDHVWMILWSKVDIATLHAEDLVKEAATIHMKLEPLIERGQSALKNHDRDPSRRIQSVADKIKLDLQMLQRVLDKILVTLGAEHLLRERCEMVEGSGGGEIYDEMTPIIDCDEYDDVVVDGSGDDVEDGSGDLEDILVDIEQPTRTNTSLEIKGETHKGAIDVDITDMTNVSASVVDETGSIDIDDDLDGKIVLPSDGGTSLKNTDDADGKPTDVDVKIEKDSEIASAASQGNGDKGSMETTTVAALNKAIVLPGDSDDEDIIQEALRTKTTKSTIKSTTARPTPTKQATIKPSTVKPATSKPSTTESIKVKPSTAQLTTAKPSTTKPTTVKPSTTKPTTVIPSTTKPTEAPLQTTTEDAEKEDDGDFNIANWFGWSLDEAVTVNTTEPDISNLSFNELLRLRLSNLAIASRDIYGNATVRKEKAVELVLTWRKLKDRFERHEDRTNQARAFSSRWKAEQATFETVHNRVHDVLEDVTLKVETVQSLSAKAIEQAERKYQKMKAGYDSRQEQVAQAADPEAVKEVLASVVNVKGNVDKIKELTQLAPSPCKVLEAYDVRMKANISELRQKIKQAKLIASSLQVAVKLDGSSHLSIPLQKIEHTQSVLTNRLDMVAKVTDDDGVLVAVETNKTGSFALKMEDRTPRVMAFDGGKFKIDDLSTNIELEKDVWYRFVLERIAQTFNLTVYNVTSKAIISNGSVVFGDKVNPAQSAPIAVYVGGLSDEFYDYGNAVGCVGALTLDGQVLSLLLQDSGGKLAKSCTPDSNIYDPTSALVLDGSGFAQYDVSHILRTQRSIHSVGMKFRPSSEGLLLSFSNRQLGLFARAVLEEDGLLVHIRLSRGGMLSALSETPLYGADHSLEFNFHGRPSVKVDGTHILLKPVSDSAGISDGASEGLFVGAAPTYNTSLVGCIHSVTVNKNSLLLSGASELRGGFFGTCRKRSCVSFSKSSSAIVKKSVTGAKVIHIVFAYGSVGPMVNYIKDDKKFDVTVSVDDTMVELFEAVGDTTKKIPLKGYTMGDLVTVTLTDDIDDDEVSVKAGDKTMSVEYEGGGGGGGLWFVGGGDDDDDEDATYTISVGLSEEGGEQFNGRIVEVVINGRPVDLSAYLEKSSLDVCKSETHAVSHWTKQEDKEKFTCGQ